MKHISCWVPVQIVEGLCDLINYIFQLRKEVLLKVSWNLNKTPLHDLILSAQKDSMTCPEPSMINPELRTEWY